MLCTINYIYHHKFMPPLKLFLPGITPFTVDVEGQKEERRERCEVLKKEKNLLNTISKTDLQCHSAEFCALSMILDKRNATSMIRSSNSVAGI